MRASLLLLAVAVAASALAQPPRFALAPGVAVEAEDFAVKDGWKVVRNGEGNYMVDIIGFN
ncbi:MAG: hypothetical protein K2W96_18815, partial [Gemmataceae bacterium]|nr:hypothetical protein [Gemmataceae bacterium]